VRTTLDPHIEIAVRRDRAGSSEPQLIGNAPKDRLLGSQIYLQSRRQEHQPTTPRPALSVAVETRTP
jgi:hypothetical protein